MGRRIGADAHRNPASPPLTLAARLQFLQARLRLPDAPDEGHKSERGEGRGGPVLRERLKENAERAVGDDCGLHGEADATLTTR